MKTLLKILVALIIMSVTTEHIQAQNLVPNPSFEDTVNCPQFLGIDVLADWSFYRGTPDYFHNCSPVLGYNNSWGFQFPNSGEAYCGIATYHTSITNAREHLGVQLITPLVIGAKYYVSFFVSTSFNSFGNNIATNKLGALVSMSSYSDPSGSVPLPNSSTIWTDSIINDTLNWIKITGSFTADSSYQYFSVGTFFDDNNIDTNHIPNQNPPNVGLYYIDDVCLSTDSNYCSTWTSVDENQIDENQIKLFPNPTNDVIHVSSKTKMDNIQIFNSLGQIIYYKKFVKKRKVKIPMRKYRNGIYFIRINSDKKIHNSKILLTH